MQEEQSLTFISEDTGESSVRRDGGSTHEVVESAAECASQDNERTGHELCGDPERKLCIGKILCGWKGMHTCAVFLCPRPRIMSSAVPIANQMCRGERKSPADIYAAINRPDGAVGTALFGFLHELRHPIFCRCSSSADTDDLL